MEEMEGTGTKPCLKSELHERELAFAEHLTVMDSMLHASPLLPQ